MSRLAHPGYFAFIPASSTFAGALGDLIASALDIDVGSWMSAAGPSQVELTVLDWFKDWIGYPSSAAGILVSGGSAANMTALACAREALFGPMSDRVVAYAADQTHSSVARAARLLGFRPDQVRILPTDRSTTGCALDALARRDRCRRRGRPAAADRGRQRGRDEHRGRRPAAGARVDLPRARHVAPRRRRLRRLRRAHRAWSRRARRDRARRLGHARPAQVALPADRVRVPARPRRPSARQAFTINPDYLADYKSEEVNFSDLGAAAHALGPRAQDLAVVQLLRHATRSGPRSTARSIWRRWREQHRSRNAGARAALAGLARHHLLPAALRGRRGRGGARALQRRAGDRVRGDRPRAASPRRACTARTRSGCA